MNIFPEWLENIIETATMAHPNDIQGAADNAERRILDHPDFEDVHDDLIRLAIKRKIHEFRCKNNDDLRRQANIEELPEEKPKKVYNTQQKVKVTESILVREAEEETYRSYYSYFIGGTTIGDLSYEQLDEYADIEANKAAGPLANQKLLLLLKKKGSPGQQVKEFVSNEELKNLMKLSGVRWEPKPTKKPAKVETTKQR